MRGDTMRVELSTGEIISGYEYPITTYEVAISSSPLVGFDSLDTFWRDDCWLKENHFIAKVKTEYVFSYNPRMVLTERIKI